MLKDNSPNTQKDTTFGKCVRREFKPELIAKLLNQSHEKQVGNEETLNLQDEIVSIVLLILVENYIKGKIEKQKADQIDNINF